VVQKGNLFSGPLRPRPVREAFSRRTNHQFTLVVLIYLTFNGSKSPVQDGNPLLRSDKCNSISGDKEKSPLMEVFFISKVIIENNIFIF